MEVDLNGRSIGRMTRSILAVGACVLTVLASGTAGARTPPGLVIAGAFSTSTARAVAGTHASCGVRPNRRLIYESKALRLGRGPAVALVEFLIPRYHGPGRYAATAPAPYGRTAVQVVTGRNATTGVASGFYVATSGTIAIERAKDVGRPGRSASFSGTVHGRLRQQHGTARLRIDGTWCCQTDAAANG